MTSQVATSAGTETSFNNYNSLRVLTNSTVKDQLGNTVITAKTELDKDGKISEPYRSKAQSKSTQFNPNNGLASEIITESATSLMLNSKTNTMTGFESSKNTYNSLRVFLGSTTTDKDGRVVLLTDATPFINARGQVADGLRAQARSAAVEFNPNTYLKRTMITETATGLLLGVDIKTSSGKETTDIKYNTLRVEVSSETKNARGVTILQSRTNLDNDGRPVDAQGSRITNATYVKARREPD